MLTRMISFVLAIVLLLLPAASLRAEDPWVVFDGADGPGQGKRVVLIAGDDEYRSEELIPQLAKILARHHGFQCTVLFAQDPQTGEIDPGAKDNISGLEKLGEADLMVLFARFRELPDEQMKHIIDYVHSGKPILGLRTSTHAFHYTKRTDSPYAKYTWRSPDPKGGFGRLVLGETWVNHYGRHNVESTRGLIAEGQQDHPLTNGIEDGDIWGPSDVYGLTTLSGDSQPIIMGQVLTGMRPEDPPHPEKKLVPIAWTKTFRGESGKTSRVFTTTMGHGGDLQSEGFRRLLVNAVYWLLEMDVPEQAKVELVGEYDPNAIGVGGHKKGLKPSDHRL